ncbi:MAG TPA: DUF6640 family protein [Candidatus Elarobacter sp.]|nr:DUF6640 family protein [Candidatus Elarobacter sp.]
MLIGGRVLLSVVALFTIFSPYYADWNATHIYNPLWPPHAKFHNAQTMAMAVLLGLSALFFIWRGRGKAADLLPAVLFASFYWVTQALASLYPGVGWTDPNLLKPGQSLSDVPPQLKLDVVLFGVIALAAFLIARGSARSRVENANRVGLLG